MDRARMTQPEMVKGKLSYLAPELTAGDDPSVKTDLFGVGIVLWEMLTGARLYAREDPILTMNAMFHEPTPKPSSGSLRFPRTWPRRDGKASPSEPCSFWEITRK